MEFFQGLYALDILYSEYVEHVFQTTEEGKRPNSAVRNIPLFSTSSKCWKNIQIYDLSTEQKYKTPRADCFNVSSVEEILSFCIISIWFYLYV